MQNQRYFDFIWMFAGFCFLSSWGITNNAYNEGVHSVWIFLMINKQKSNDFFHAFFWRRYTFAERFRQCKKLLLAGARQKIIPWICKFFPETSSTQFYNPWKLHHLCRCKIRDILTSSGCLPDSVFSLAEELQITRTMKENILCEFF